LLDRVRYRLTNSNGIPYDSESKELEPVGQFALLLRRLERQTKDADETDKMGEILL